MNGKFIVFEGQDGAGKTTQLERAKAYYEGLGYTTLLTREPGGTLLGEQVRELVKQENREVPLDPTTFMLLFAASFAHKWHQIIAPALARGEIVLADRWYQSAQAYQGYAGGLDPEYIRETCLAATGNHGPDKSFFFDLSPEERARRLAGRGGTDAIESMGDAYFARIREGFLQMTQLGELTRVDAEGTPDEVFARLRPLLDEALRP